MQPTGIAFVSPPSTVKSGTAITYTTRPLAAAGALVDGYQAVQALSKHIGKKFNGSFFKGEKTKRDNGLAIEACKRLPFAI